MAWFHSNTLFVSVSLFCLPVLVLCAVLCLPFLIFAIVTLYLSAWTTYYFHAQTDAEFNLPYNPSRVLKINVVTAGHIVGWITYLPMIFSYLHWRYWEVGNERFKEIVSVDIPYHATSKLDVYHPTKKQKPSPIIIFVYGGSWSSGSKLIYTTMANTLREAGYVVVVPDYRKYPQVKAEGMYEDIREAIKWTHKHASQINGDPELIFIMGHSAGAHLTAQVVLSDIIEQAKYNENLQLRDLPVPPVSQKHDPSIKKFQGSSHMTDGNKPHDFLPLVEGILLFSGVYDIASHLIHETSRGVEKVSAMARAMGSCPEGYSANSPLHLIEKNEKLFSESDDLLDLWPRILLLHGQKDTTVGMDQSANMFNALGKVFSSDRRQELDIRMRLYKRMGHGEPVISLMNNMFTKKTERNLLLKDIHEFIDEPLQED